jgi:hypothetical protein
VPTTARAPENDNCLGECSRSIPSDNQGQPLVYTFDQARLVRLQIDLGTEAAAIVCIPTGSTSTTVARPWCLTSSALPRFDKSHAKTNSVLSIAGRHHPPDYRVEAADWRVYTVGLLKTVLDDGMLKDDTPNLVRELRNLIDSLVVMVRTLRDPPPGLF